MAQQSVEPALPAGAGKAPRTARGEKTMRKILDAALGEFGENGDKPGEFDSPAGIAVDPGDRVYVADSDNHRIQAFSLV